MPSEDTNSEAMLQCRNRRPFVPFALVLKTGERLIVAEPSRIVIQDSNVMVVTDGGGLTTLSISQIASVDGGEGVEELRQLIRGHLLQQPFSPFCIVMTDGQRLPIVRYLQAAVGLTTFLVGYPSSEGNVARQYYLRNVRKLETAVTA